MLTIIKELGYSNANANLLSVSSYFFGFLTTLLVAIVSDDRLLQRGIFIIGGMLVVIVRYAIILTNVSNGVKYCTSHPQDVPFPGPYLLAFQLHFSFLSEVAVLRRNVDHVNRKQVRAISSLVSFEFTFLVHAATDRCIREQQ
jgi:hypothetical protein